MPNDTDFLFRIIPSEITVSRTHEAGDGRAGASLAGGWSIKLEIVDMHTKKGVSAGAEVKSVRIDGEDGDSLFSYESNLVPVLPNKPPEYARPVIVPPFRGNRARLAWLSFLQCAVALLELVKGVSNPYTGPFNGAFVEGENWDQFQRDHLAPVYQKVTGEEYNQTKNEKGVAVRLFEALPPHIVTSDSGDLMIPVPANSAGTVILEMKHLKLIDPKDAAAVDAANARGQFRAVYKRQDNKVTGDPDAPGSKQQQSNWHLDHSGNEKDAKPFQNFINIRYTRDDFSLMSPVICRKTYALVWCQPTWCQRKWDEIVMRADHPERPVPDPPPTLLCCTGGVPTGTDMAYGPEHYGEYGEEGRRKPNFFGYLARLDKAGTEQATLIGYKKKNEADAGGWCLLRSGVPNGPVKNGFEQEEFLEDYLILPEYSETAQFYKSPEDLLKAFFAKDATHTAKKDGYTCYARKQADGQWVVVYNGAFKHTSKPYRTLTEAFLAENDKKPHAGIDCAGNPGDPVFATCGGNTTYEDRGNKGIGKNVTVTPWYSRYVTKLQYGHLDKALANAGQIVKAGDVIGVMGRSGNIYNVPGSPSHVHIQCGRSLEELPKGMTVDGHGQVFPIQRVAQDRPLFRALRQRVGYSAGSAHL